MCSFAYAQLRSTFGFLSQWFSSPIRDEASQFWNQQAVRWSGAHHGSIWDSWPIAFSGGARGP